MSFNPYEIVPGSKTEITQMQIQFREAGIQAMNAAMKPADKNNPLAWQAAEDQGRNLFLLASSMLNAIGKPTVQMDRIDKIGRSDEEQMVVMFLKGIMLRGERLMER